MVCRIGAFTGAYSQQDAHQWMRNTFPVYLLYIEVSFAGKSQRIGSVGIFLGGGRRYVL